jgi:1-acyl-sn-glycerol-3-phosphate acyltransferase
MNGKPEERRKQGNLPQPGFSVRFWFLMLRGFGWLMSTFAGPWKAYGLENIPRKGPMILAANHMSYLDPIVAGWCAPRLYFAMGKKQLFETPMLGRIMPFIGSFPVDQEGSPRAAIRSALEILKRGDAVAGFPEGERTRGVMGKGQPGGGLIARKSGAPVIPCLITGTHLTLSPDHPGLRGGPITISFGKPLRFDPNEKPVDLDADAQRIMDAIEGLRAETPGAIPAPRLEDLPPPRDG